MQRKHFYSMRKKIRKLELNDGDVLILPDELRVQEWNQLIDFCFPMRNPPSLYFVCGDVEKLSNEDMNKIGWFNQKQVENEKYKSELYEEVWTKAKSLGFMNVTMALVELEKLMVKK